MKVVYLNPDNTIREIIPEYALPVAEWYGEAFARNCVEAPDEVDQRWIYDPETGEFSEPPEYNIIETTLNPESDQDAMLIDQEYRLTLLELGLTE